MLCPFCQQTVSSFEPAASGPGLRCPACGDEDVPRLYPVDYATHPAVPVCIFGPTGHGKSVYIDALLHHLETRTRWPRFSHQWLSQVDMEATRARLRLLREHGALPDATPAVFPRPQALRLRNVPRVGGCQLLFFDNSGETFRQVELFTEAGRYIRAARSVIWLVSLTDLEYPQQLSDLMTVYAEAMRAMGGDPKEQTIIMALTKGDLLLGDGSFPRSARDFLESDALDPAGDAWTRLSQVSADLERWLGEGEQANVVNLLADLFRAARFCVVSAQGAAADESNRLALDIMPRGVLAPLFWLWRETLPTITLEAGKQRSLHFSLLDAVAAAPPDAVIRLGPHTYTLPRRLEIGKPLTIVGEGPAATCITCDDDKFTVGVGPTAGTVKLSDLTVRHRGDKSADVIRVVRGALALDRCHVTGGRVGGDTIPGDGVLVMHEAEATVCGADLSGNQGNGLDVRERARATVRDTKLTQNMRAGLLVLGAKADAHGCILSQNGLDGAALGAGSQCVLTNNRCQNNGRNGIKVTDTCQADLRENYCAGSQKYGILAGGRAVVSGVENVCAGNEQSGVLIRDRASGAFHKTKCHQNGACGIAVSGDATPTLSENDCRENMSDGIRVSDAAIPTLNANLTQNNTGYGVKVVAPAKPTVGAGNVARGNARGETDPPGLFRKGWFR